MYFLDTDTLTLAHAGHPQISDRLRRVNAEQVAIVPVKSINPTRYYGVRLRQSRRCASSSVDPSDSSRQCNVQDPVAAKSDSVGTANSGRLA